MWLFVVSIVYGMFVALDPILFVFIGYNLAGSGIYMGLLSALWSLAYIVTSRVLNSIADEGHNRFLLLIALGSLGTSYICFRSLNYVTATVSYIMHAVSVASMNLAVSVSILEDIDSEFWQATAVLHRSLSNSTRGILMLIMSFRETLSVNHVFWLSLVFGAASFILMPSISVSFERRFYRLGRSINELGTYIRASSSVLFLDKPDIARHIYAASWNRWGPLPLYRVLISISMSAALGDSIFTVVPYILRNYMALNSMWMAYGVASLFSAIIVIIFKDLSMSRRSFAIPLMMIRMCVLVLGFSMIRDMVSLTIYIVLSSLLYMLIDVTLYNMFIESSAGFSTADYFTSREIGSILGSIIGGVMIGFGNNTFLATATAIGILAALALV